MNFLDDVNNCQLLEELVYFLHSNIYSLLQNSAQSEEYFSCCTCSGTFLQILIFWCFKFISFSHHHLNPHAFTNSIQCNKFYFSEICILIWIKASALAREWSSKSFLLLYDFVFSFYSQFKYNVFFAHPISKVIFVYIWFDAFPASEYNEVFSGYQPGKVVQLTIDCWLLCLFKLLN